MNSFKKGIKIALVAVCATTIATAAFAKKDDYWYGKTNKPIKNVIMMIPDGCSASIQTLSRLVKGAPLNVDKLTTGAVQTYMTNSVITGSAAAATAFATGHKTTVRFLGVGPRTSDLLTGFEPTADPYVPIASVLEGARLQGRSTGLVATSRITHATPAAYACHIQDRGMDNEIMEHMVYQNIDVVFGGGARHLLMEIKDSEGNCIPQYTTSFGDEWCGKRKDGENLMQVLLDRGYTFVDSKDGMQALSEGPVWGLFDDSHMDPDLDRDDLHPTQPSIAEMTGKAIELLSQNRNGFFLMVEGSQVDWAGHANDAAYMVGDFLAFDEAVGKALEFAEADGKTLVLIFPDHNTGALSIGHEQSDFPPGYTGTSLEAMIDPIKKANMTIQQLLYEVPGLADENCDAAGVIATFENRLGDYWADGQDSVWYWDEYDEDGNYVSRTNHAQYVADVLNANGAYGGYYPIAAYVSKHMTDYGWTTHGHTGEDVPLWAYGPAIPVGTFENTELAEMVADKFGFKLHRVTNKLFVDAFDALPGAKLDFPEDDLENPVLVYNGAKLPISKDYIELPNGKKKYLPGIVVYAPEIEKVFIPQKAVNILN
jgi:alkaline phosphatase